METPLFVSLITIFLSYFCQWGPRPAHITVNGEQEVGESLQVKGEWHSEMALWAYWKLNCKNQVPGGIKTMIYFFSEGNGEQEK